MEVFIYENLYKAYHLQKAELDNIDKFSYVLLERNTEADDNHELELNKTLYYYLLFRHY